MFNAPPCRDRLYALSAEGRCKDDSTAQSVAVQAGEEMFIAGGFGVRLPGLSALEVAGPHALAIVERGTVEGYLNIPIEELADRLEEVPRDRAILTA